jgi:hypothetical protein
MKNTIYTGNMSGVSRAGKSLQSHSNLESCTVHTNLPFTCRMAVLVATIFKRALFAEVLRRVSCEMKGTDMPNATNAASLFS